MSEEAKRYIKKYFRLEFLVFYDSLSDKKNGDELDTIVIGIGTFLSNKYKTKDIISGKADHLIYKMLEEAIKKRFPDKYFGNINIRRYIKNYIQNNFFVKNNDKTLNYIVERIALKIGPLVDYNKLMNGDEKTDNRIASYYEEIYKDTVERVQKYIKNYLIRNIYPMLDIDEVEVANELSIKIMSDNKYSVVDLFTKKYDTMIEQTAYANRRKNEQNKPDSLRYVKVYIIKELDHYLEHEELHVLSMSIEATLREEGANTKDIVEHKCDNKIRYMYQLYIMRKNSVQKEDKPKKIKHNPVVKKIFRTLLTLLLVGTIAVSTVVSLFGCLFKWVRDFIDERSADLRYNRVTSQMVGDQYDRMFTKYSDEYELNMDSVVQVYNDMSKFGDIYGYVGFYEAYKHTYGYNRLAVMDLMLKEMDRKIDDGKYKDKEAPVETKLNINTHYFLEFAYDRLIEMGCEEIKQDKYSNAVDQYISYAVRNTDENKTTMNCIQAEDEELSKTIKYIMELYHQYSSKCYQELYDIYFPNGAKGRS